MSLLLAVVMCVGLAVSGVQFGKPASAAETVVSDKSLAVDSSETILLQDTHPAFCQKDLNDNFLHYAIGDSCLTLPTSYNLSDTVANVVGVVLDEETDEPIPGATVSVDGELFVTTDLDGRFQIRNLPNGTYVWGIFANDYQNARYINYSVDWASGTDIFTFKISKVHEIIKDRLEPWITNQSSTNCIDNRNNQPTGITAASVSIPPSIKESVRVKGYSNPIPREQYVYTVLSSELYPDNWYMTAQDSRTKKLTSSQVNQLYMAQAIVANTYVEYAISVQGNHPGASYDVCASTNCQVYDPVHVTKRAIDCTASIFFSDGNTCHVLFYKNANAGYDYALCQFFSSCHGAGTVADSYHPETVTQTCSDFDTGYGGHRHGMCQMGAAELARLGYGCGEILEYYYANCTPLLCNLKRG